ncbi:hypothetical protein M9H77_03136 [Catharanthus roseus]|uniref:Uncharacterized protein n=1 Tax=Catharanthus roseus TaxID=4058 RepID=A0ACC0CAA3_CATRO|nr:hypothetical protein M9H77_03136 [Catharanthus roseus]
MQQALEGLEQQLSCLAKDVGDIKREEEDILEISRRNLGGHSMHNNQWAYGTFSPYARTSDHNSYKCYEGNRLGARNACEQEMKSLFYSYSVRDEEKFQIVITSFSNVVDDWWNCNCEYRRIRFKPIKTRGLVKQTLRIKYGVKNHEGQGRGQAKVKFMEPSIVEESPKVKELKHATN